MYISMLHFKKLYPCGSDLFGYTQNWTILPAQKWTILSQPTITDCFILHPCTLHRSDTPGTKCLMGGATPWPVLYWCRWCKCRCESWISFSLEWLLNTSTHKTCYIYMIYMFIYILWKINKTFSYSVECAMQDIPLKIYTAQINEITNKWGINHMQTRVCESLFIMTSGAIPYIATVLLSTGNHWPLHHSLSLIQIKGWHRFIGVIYDMRYHSGTLF